MFDGKTESIDGGIAQLARAPALQAGGQRFDPAYLHHSTKVERGAVRNSPISAKGSPIKPFGRISIMGT